MRAHDRFVRRCMAPACRRRRARAGLSAVLLACLLLLPLRARAEGGLLESNLGIPTSDQVNIYVAEDLGLFDPELPVNAYVKRLGASPGVAREVVKRECCGSIPTFAAQLDPASPFSFTSRTGGVAATLSLATEALFAVKAVPAAIPLSTLQ